MRLAAVLLALTMVAGCTTFATDGGGDLRGVWLFESYTESGVPVEVQEGVNAVSQPYMVIDGNQVTGESGCNGFGGDIEYMDGVLHPGEMIFEAAGCVPETLMDTEMAFQDLVWSGEEIQVSFEDITMTWEGAETSMTFVSADEPPPVSTIPPQTSFGPLDCGAEPLIREQVSAEGSDLESFMTAGRDLIGGLAGVTAVEQQDPNRPIWFGYDISGAPVVVVAFDDVSPPMFSIYTCA